MAAPRHSSENPVQNPATWFILLFVLTLLGLASYYLISQSPLFAPQTEPPIVSASLPPVENALLQDGFDNPNSGWPVESLEYGRYGYQEPGFYYLRVVLPNQRLVVSPELSVADFTAKTTTVVNYASGSSGFRYGLVFRRTGDQYYAFALSPSDRVWQLLKGSSRGVEVLSEGQTNLLRSLYRTYALEVSAQGNLFNVSLDGQAVTQFRDSSYSSGEVGFFLETIDQTLAHVLFNSLTVQPLEMPIVPAENDPVQSTAPEEDSAIGAVTIEPSPTLTPQPTATTPISTPTPTPTQGPATPTSTASPTVTNPPPTEETVSPPARTPLSEPNPATTPDQPVDAETETPTVEPEVTNPPDHGVASNNPGDIPIGDLTLLHPVDFNDPSYGVTEFEWIWTGPLPPEYSFEVRVWRGGEPMAGVHDAVDDALHGRIENLADNRYRLITDISNAAGVQGYRGEYFWTVALVRVSPEYVDLGIVAPAVRIRFETPG